MFDVAIIGAGVVGCAIARELSRNQGSFCVIEKEEDVCCGTSKANTAIIHAGFDALPGTWKAKLNVQSSQQMDALACELDFPFIRNGAYVVARSDVEEKILNKLYIRGIENGVKHLRILSREEAIAEEPKITRKVTAVLEAKDSGIVCPFTMTVAFAENAAENGVEFFMNHKVKGLSRGNGVFYIKTNHGIIETKCVVNAAGVFADEIHNMISEKKIHITPRKGEYLLTDKIETGFLKRTIFTVPSEISKGVIVTPTVHGNLLMGPTAEEITDKEDTATSRAGLDKVRGKAGSVVENLPYDSVITSFAGIRAHARSEDFVIGELEDVPGFIDVAGIDSPGLSSAPAIGSMVAEMVKRVLKLSDNAEFNGSRSGIVNFSSLTDDEKKELIRENISYSNIVCRCENITEGEILEAIRRRPGASSLDGVKRRVRAGMGRCQGGFCSPRVMELLAEELSVSPLEITKKGRDSWLLGIPDREESV